MKSAALIYETLSLRVTDESLPPGQFNQVASLCIRQTWVRNFPNHT